ncbi:MAG TPA: substrate-binding domain-containing protein, partial [Solirubrobacteraceae bacterium]|nr:substrate-binding domain-containing protein [Solirubrobacteraceae bacterium]
ACGSSSKTASSVSSGASSAGVAQAKAVVARLSQPTRTYAPPGPAINARSLSGKSVWYIPLSLSVPVFAIANNTLQTALGKAGITEHSCSGEANPSATSACINQAVNGGAGAIITDAIPVALAANAFANAQSHHIPVLVVDQLPPAAGSPGAVPGYGNDKLAYSPLQAASLVSAEADWTIADSNGKANVLLMPYTDSPSTLSYDATTVAVFKKLCPGCQLAEQKIGIATASLTPSQTSSALLSHQGVQYVLPEYDALDQGVLQGIQQSGFAHKVKVVTSAGDLPALQAIKAGQLAVDVGESFPYGGWADADEAMRMMLGKPIVTEKPPLRMFTAANVGSLALTPAAQANGSWYGSSAYTTMFEHLWGLG